MWCNYKFTPQYCGPQNCGPTRIDRFLVAYGRVFRAHLQSSVLHYPKIIHNLYIKNGRSDTPLSRARKPFILELSDSAEAFVDRSMK